MIQCSTVEFPNVGIVALVSYEVDGPSASFSMFGDALKVIEYIDNRIGAIPLTRKT